MSLTALRSIINATLLTIATFITSAAATADEAPQQQVDYAQHPAVEAANQSLGEKQDLVPSLADPPPLPTIEDIRRGNHFDWLITKDDKILVVRPVEPRPDTLAKIAAEVENLTAERGGLMLERQRRQQRLEELQSLTVELFDQPSTKYKIKVDQIREIRHFEDLVQQRAEELKRLENTISEGEELLAAFRAPVDAERKAVSTTLFDKSALTRCDLHVVGMYMPRDHHHDDRVYVDVKATGKPMVLVLTGYFGAEWHLDIDPNADVRQVIVAGYYKHELAEPKPDVPIAVLTYFPRADQSNRNFFWAYAWHTAEGRELRRRLKDLTGLEVTTFQGEYAATRFVIDGTRGRDVVTGKTNGDERPSGLGGWFQNLIGSSDTDDRPPLPQPPVDDSSTNQPNTETSKPVIRKQLEAAREQAEAVHRDAEQASLQAAHDYRDELSQASPDKKALADRRQRLHQAVKAAFEAQMQLQQIRLQLAQLDLAEVKAKHQQRQTLADKIIERRVADLMSGEDLEWPQAAAQRSETNATASPPRNNDGKQAAEPDQQLGGIQADPELDGEWVMLDYSGPGIVAHREGVRVMTSVGKWKLVDQTVLEINCERILDRESVPAKIDLIPLDTSNLPVSRGIYRVEGDTLTIAWAPHIFGVAPRPTDFSGKTGIVQTLKRVTPVPKFATPQELVDYVTRLNAEASEDEVATMDQMFDLVTDDEINRFAGLMLRTTSMMQMAAGLGAAFGNSEGSGGDDQRQQVAAFLPAVGRMNLIVDKYRHKSPAPEALAAYQKIAGGLNLSMLFQGGAPTTTVGVEKYSQTLRLAAGVLNDPKAFLSEILKEMQTIEATQSAATGKESDSKVKPDWQVTVNGDSAFAIDRSAKPEASNTMNLTGTTQSMDLIKVGDTWKISSLIPDNVIIEMQQGPAIVADPKLAQ